MSHPLDSARLKIERADEQLADLTRDANAFFQTGPYEIVVEHDEQTGDQVLRARVLREPPLNFAVVVGDIVHELRSSLDHVVWQLVLVNDDQPDGSTEFPIFWEPKAYASAGQRKIRGVGTAAAAQVERLQPYKVGERFRDHALYVVHQLNIRDKHQTLNIVGAAFQKQRLNLGAGGGAEGAGVPSFFVSKKTQLGGAQSLGVHRKGVGTVWFGGLAVGGSGMIPLRDGAEVLRIRTEGNPSVDVQAELAYAMVFDQSGPGKGQAVLPLLRQLIDSVRVDVELFAPFFADHAGVSPSTK